MEARGGDGDGDALFDSGACSGEALVDSGSGNVVGGGVVDMVMVVLITSRSAVDMLG